MTECPAGNSQTAGKIGKISFAAISRHSDNPSGVLRKVVRSVFSKKKSSIKRIFRAENCGNKKIRLSLHPQQGGLAQLARALAWHARGHQFDPGILHALKKTIFRWSFCFYAMQKSTPGMVIITLTGFPRLSQDEPSITG